MIRSTRPLLLASTLGVMGVARPGAAATPTPTPTPTATPTCDVTGTVVDAEDHPVAGLDIRLSEGEVPRHTITDAEGRFRFATVPEATEVVAVLGEGGPKPRFTIVDDGQPVELTATVDPAAGCEVTLNPDAGPPMAPDLLALYQGLRRGFALMDQLGIRGTEPLQVEANDAIASPEQAYWAGTSSFHPQDTLTPRLVLGTQASRRDDPGAPDNREYHELGHHALATAFGALPRARDDAPEGDYHHNPSSTHAFTEGFAIFFAAMVAREIDQRPDAGRYRVEGAWLDLELDYRPWDLRGTESIAVASLLWDMVDGDRPPADDAPLHVVDPQVYTDAGVPYRLVGQVHNPSDTRVTPARVHEQGDGFSGTAPVGPRQLSAGGQGWFALPLPASIGEREDPLAALTLRATPWPGAPDDDPVEVKLADLWTAIVELRSERPDSNGRLFDVADLYQALRGRFGRADADADGRDDIDQLFVAHGLFADENGNRAHEPAEAIGPTSHPSRRVEVDGKVEIWPSLSPRHRLTLPDPLRMDLELDPPEGTVVVLVSGSSWGGYLAQPDAQGQIRLVPPPAREGASVSVVGLAAGRAPAVLWHRDATELLAELETHRTPYLAVRAQLAPAREGPGSGHAEGPGWPRLAFGGGALAALVGLLLMAIGWPRLR